MSQGLAGAVAALILAEAGADVVKIEPPGGDLARSSPGFATWNRSKRGLVLDLHDAADRTRLDDLLRDADVLIHNLRPAAARRAGLDDSTLVGKFEQLVVCAIPAYPGGHPDEARRGFDNLILARSGLCDEQAASRPGPIFWRFPLASWGAAYLAAIGILARLSARRVTGVGGLANTSLLQGALSMATLIWSRAEHPTEAFSQSLPKHLRATIFECADGVSIHVPYQSPDAVPLMRQALDEMGPDGVRAANEAWPSELGVPNAGANRVAFRLHGSQTWLDALWDSDVPAQPVLPLGEILRDADAAINGYVVSLDDPVYGRVRQAGMPFAINPPARVSRPAPVLGQDNVSRFDDASVRPFAPTTDELIRWPLEGLTVVDLGQFIAGPFAGTILADLGADVIKVETLTGDPVRMVERPFMGSQRGKRSLAIDLRKPEAREVLDALVSGTDVVLHNLRMPAARRLGLDPDRLHSINSRLIYCHLSAYGAAGHRADWPGYDALFQALAGWELEGAGIGNPPMWHRFGILDQLTGMSAVIAVLMALEKRHATGQGQIVGTSILGTSVLTVSETMLLADGGIAAYPRLDSQLTGISPECRMYEVADGWVAVGAVTKAHRAALRDVVGVSDLAAAATIWSGWPAEKLLDELTAAGVPAEFVRTDQLDAFLDDPANVAAGLSVSYEHPVYGRLDQIGALWNLGDLDVRLERCAPLLGQHTVEVLTELGWSPDGISRLCEKGVVVAGAEKGSR